VIDPRLFTVEALLSSMLDDSHGNRNKWGALAEVVPDYMPPHPQADTRPKCVVKCGLSFLRYSAGPRQGHFWDMYGDDYQTPALALMALLEAPIPPSYIDQHVWTACANSKAKAAT
jgi:hypothetical protein